MARSKRVDWPLKLHLAMREQFRRAKIRLEREPSVPQFDRVVGRDGIEYARHNYAYLFEINRTALHPDADIEALCDFIAPITNDKLRPPRRAGLFAKHYRLAKGRAARVNLRVERTNEEDETETTWFAACHVLNFDSAFEQTIAYVHKWMLPQFFERYKIEAITGIELSFDAPATFKGDTPNAANPNSRRRKRATKKPATKAKGRAARKNAPPTRKRK